MDIDEVKDFAKSHLEKNDQIHGWSHTTRVRDLCIRLGEEEGADLEVLELAALLHDIGIHKDRERHAEISADLAEKILQDYEKKEEVIHCIKTHRFSKDIKSESLEAKILRDGDKLDAIGAVGILRTASLSGRQGKPIHKPKEKTSSDYNSETETTIDHFFEKLLKIKDKLHTESAKDLANHRHDFMKRFIEEFFRECRGET